MNKVNQITTLATALRSILQIAAEPGNDSAIEALKECQRIAAEGLEKAGLEEGKTMPFKRMRDFKVAAQDEIEAAAQALCDLANEDKWEETPEPWREDWRTKAHTALEAAARVRPR